MTISASRIGETQDVKVQFTYGSVTASITENVGHLESFRAQLDSLIMTIREEG